MLDEGWSTSFAKFVGVTEPSDDDSEDFIIRDLIPRGEPWMLAGKWKGGKTWTAVWIAICVALGRDCLGFDNTLRRPGRVQLILLEDNARRIRKRIWAIARGLALTEADFATLRANLRISDRDLRLPGPDVVRLRDELLDWKPDVVIVDSLSRVMVGNQNSTEDSTAFTHVWRELVRSSGAAIGFLHHTTKANLDHWMPESDPFDLIRGSGEFVAAARNVVLMQKIGGAKSNTSKVRICGNLELRRDGFILEYTRKQVAERNAVVLVNRGDIQPYEVEQRATAREQNRAARNTQRESVDNDRTRKILLLAKGGERATGTAVATLLTLKASSAGKYVTAVRGLNLLDAKGHLTAAGERWLAEHPA